MMKFDAGISGTFSGAPGSEARPAETSHDSGLIPDGCLSIVSHASRQEDFCCGTAGSNANGITARVARPHLFCAAGWQSSTPLYWPFALWGQAFRLASPPIRGRRQVAIVAIFGGPVSQGFHLLAQAVHLLCVLLDHGVLLGEQRLLLDEFVSLRQLFSQDLLLCSSCPYSTRFGPVWQVPCGPGLFPRIYKNGVQQSASGVVSLAINSCAAYHSGQMCRFEGKK